LEVLHASPFTPPVLRGAIPEEAWHGTQAPAIDFHAKREKLERFAGLSCESQCHNLA
jgi:hypothetical protein